MDEAVGAEAKRSAEGGAKEARCQIDIGDVEPVRQQMIKHRPRVAVGRVGDNHHVSDSQHIPHQRAEPVEELVAPDGARIRSVEAEGPLW